jgi:hypothetical protein
MGTGEVRDSWFEGPLIPIPGLPRGMELGMGTTGDLGGEISSAGTRSEVEVGISV